MKKRTKRICAFFLNLILVIVMVQQGLVVSDASSTSAITQTDQSDTASDSSQETVSDSEGDSVQTDQSSADTSSSSGELSSDSAADAQNADNGDDADSSDENDSSQSITKENDYTVTVNYGEDAGIPEDAKLQVKEITDASAVENYTEQAESALNGTTVSAARFFDISFVKDDQEVEPQADVDVEIALAGSLEASDGTNVKAIHFDETSGSDSPEVLDVNTTEDSEGNVEKVQFTQSSFSVTGVIVSDTSSWSVEKDSWPVDGTYIMIVQNGSSYYAVNNTDGSLTEVTYKDGKVSFPSIDSVSDINDYEWDIVSPNKEFPGYGLRIMHGVGNHAVYIDLSADSAITVRDGKDADNLFTNKNFFIKVWLSNSKVRDSYQQEEGTHYLAVNESGLTRTTDENSAANVFFASDFSVDGSDDSGTEGGEDTVDDLSAPEAGKTLVDNEDGTYELSLSIKGQAKSKTEKTKAQVLVVLDTSGSMIQYGTDRLSAAKEALVTLSEELLSENTGDTTSVEMSMFTFNNIANDDWTGWINDSASFDDAVNSVSAKIHSGTNWEDALSKANSITFNDDVDKYVIFVSDGNPSFYNTPYGDGIDQTDYEVDENYNKSTETTYQMYGIWGTGRDLSTTNVHRSYIQARDKAKAIVDSGKNFYTISAFQDVSRMSNITAYAYSGSDVGTYPAQRYQETSDLDSLKEAFDNIVRVITKNFNYANVQFTDKLTSMTSSTVVDGDVNKFTYTVTDDKGNVVTVTSNGDNTYSYTNSKGETKTFRGATCDEDGKITWNMNVDDDTPFLLDGGYTYNVSFTVWPSQQAYDLVADLNNGSRLYSDLSDEEKEQVVKSGSTYSLKTNEDGTKVVYKTAVTKTEDDTTTISYGDQQTSYITNPDPVELAGTMFSVSKVWDDNNDSSNRPESITLRVIRDKGTDQEVKSEEIYLSSDNGWTQEYYIAPGLIVGDQTLDSGHTYDIEEEDTNVHYELDQHTYHPFLIDSNSTIYDGTTTDSSQIMTLTATNKLRGSVTLVKKVEDAKGKDITTVADSDDSSKTVVNPAIADDEFTFDVTLKTPNAHTDADYGYEFYNQDQYTAESPEAASSGQLNNSGEISDYKLTSSDTKTTVTFKVVLKPAGQFRLSYVPIGTEVEINEQSVTGYSFKQADVYINNSDSSSSSATELPLKGTTIANENGKIVFTNKIMPFDLKLTKTDNTDKANILAGAEFSLKLVKSGETDETETDAYDVYGNKIETITAGELSEIGDLPSGTYRLTETRAPDGYARGSDITFTVDHSKVGTEDAANAVQITDGGSAASVNYNDNATTSLDDDSYVITVKNDKIYELPSFGGHGIFWNTILGTLIAMFFAYAGFTMRSNEERRHKT